MPECEGELSGGFPVDAQPGGALAGRRRVLEHRLDVPGCVGVVRQTGRVDRSVHGRRQRGQDRAMQRDPPVGRDRLLDR